MSRDHSPRPSDRRRAPRHPAHRLPSLRASILAGPDVAVINVSRGGLLLESEVRLRPNAGLCLNVVLDGETHRLDGHVQHVDARIVNGRVVYRAGIAFDEEVGIFDPPCGDRRPARAAGPVPVPPIDVAVSHPGQRDLDADLARTRDERDAAHRQLKEQARTIAVLRQTLESGERLRQEMLDAHAAEGARWRQEQQDLAERVREAEDQAASMVQDMRAARDAARRAARDHAAQLAAHDARVRERDQQIAALRAEQAALLESLTAQLDAYERRDEAREAHQGRLNGQLAATEAWCVDQQHLLYRIRHQMSTVFALLEGADVPEIDDRLLVVNGSLGAKPLAPAFPARQRPIPQALPSARDPGGVHERFEADDEDRG